MMRGFSNVAAGEETKLVKISKPGKIIETLSVECAVPKLAAWKHRAYAK